MTEEQWDHLVEQARVMSRVHGTRVRVAAGRLSGRSARVRGIVWECVSERPEREACDDGAGE